MINDPETRAGYYLGIGNEEQTPDYHAIANEQQATVIDTKEGIEMYRLMALRSALVMEMKGMTFKSGKASVTVRNLLGSTTRTKTKLYEELCNHIDALKRKEKRMKIQRNDVITCNKCDAVDCPYRNDPYNTYGDCLASK